MSDLELTDALKREIGQHFVFGFHGILDDIKDDSDIVRLIRDYHLGNVILMKRNVRSLEQVNRIVHKLQILAHECGHIQPLLIGIDQENGLVSALSSSQHDAAGTQFPGAMALAATGSLELTEKVSAASGKEMRIAGINWVYSPVADVNSDPRNPVIGVRSFGDDPKEAGQYAAAASRGLTSADVAPCAKHFPGHGDTHVDSHLALPTIRKTKSQLLATELVPFTTLIRDESIPTIMTGHMSLPLLTGDDKLPCSLSRTITTDLLRRESGFDAGVIVTDCLEMEAVASETEAYGSERGAVMSLQAGADVAMICHTMKRQRGAIELTYEVAKKGELDLDELRESGDRIRKLKDRFCGSWEEVLGSQFDVVEFQRLKEANKKLSKEAYEASTALVSDPAGQIPLAKEATGGNVVLFTPAMDKISPVVDDNEEESKTKSKTIKNTAGPAYLALASSLQARVGKERVEHIVYAGEGDREQELPTVLLQRAGAVVFAMRNAHGTRTWQVSYLRRVLKALSDVGSKAKVVVVATCAPYDLVDADELLDGSRAAYLATFEFTSPALEAAVGVVFGERRAAGKVPVLGGKVLG